MKALMLAATSALFLAACGQESAQDSQPHDLSPTPTALKTLQDPDAKTLFDIMKRSGLTPVSSIESSQITTDAAFCTATVSPATNLPAKLCQFSVGGGLFVRASAADAEAMIGLLKTNKVVSRTIANGRRWDLRNLQCQSRFVVLQRQLVTTCTFKQ